MGEYSNGVLTKIGRLFTLLNTPFLHYQQAIQCCRVIHSNSHLTRHHYGLRTEDFKKSKGNGNHTIAKKAEVI
jgi:hypothetical protein